MTVPLDLRRERMAFPELLGCAVELAKTYPTASVVIEDAGSGISLIQSLQSKGIRPLSFRPVGEKVVRAAGQTAKMQAGDVLLPRSVPWLDEFRTELLSFPGKHDDQVDSMVQALSWMDQQRQRCGTVIVGRYGPTRGA